MKMIGMSGSNLNPVITLVVAMNTFRNLSPFAMTLNMTLHLATGN